VRIEDQRIDRIIRENQLHQCLECGKCSASCPRLVHGKEYSPRLLAHKLISERTDSAFIENSVWECLTCGLCAERCPSGIDFSGFILEMRTLLAASDGLKGYRSHDGALHSWMRMMTSPELDQNRLEWITPELKTREAGEIAFFTGCAPYFDVFFMNLEVKTLEIARDSIRLLNFLDIQPVILPNERCCGHDLLWSGDQENFELLCRLNYEAMKERGVKKVVTSCPECHLVLAKHMPKVIKEFDLEITLLVDLLDQEVKKGAKGFEPLKRKATYHDPCRLGRMEGRYEEPRRLMAQIPELTIKEMENSRHSAICCGNCGFINCDAYSKKIQIERLKQLKDTKADLLITACPKCMIHLTCAMKDPIRGESLKTEIRDLASVLADQIKWKE